ncbi:MAG: tRNA uridine-5-carboxymethylaminomethyl(34) synthesis enzyme MnmG [Caldithrix sp. RBG_13_44_9]|nr:MAG: tRNA uridine-5-carboxymethylaminomethyl(34) synthesis enzyme MnmG [Caldithrix sp. RBG_13_44_9]
MNRNYDVIVAGGGHAGIEAALATARLGLRTALVTLRIDTIGKMSCNPAIGGLAKGHLVREIDALGGEMAKLTDRAGIHFKILNKSKGPAVWSPRAQADRLQYSRIARQVVLSQPNLEVISASVNGLKVTDGKVVAALLNRDEWIPCRALILTCGTFLNGRIYIGLNSFSSGRAGEMPVRGLTEALVELGFISGRLKTGTPPRVHRDSLDYRQMEEQPPDRPPVPFSFQTDTLSQEQLSCHITHTNQQTHEFLRMGLDRSPMYTGLISGVGPRYCPSIEDKVVRFSDKERHQLFLEPDGFDNPEVYVNGFATSLPEDIQYKALRSVAGMERAHIIRLGYAVEYDFFPSYQIQHTLETKNIAGLYFAGQINGTSGYEEAAAQGLMAGINAALKLQDQPPLILDRSRAYIGVLIDDLISKTILEPYRMFTSRAEFRLLLRHDNADLRLMETGKEIRLLPDAAYRRMLNKRQKIEQLLEHTARTSISPQRFNELAKKTNSSFITQSVPMRQLMRRPEISLKDLLEAAELDDGYSHDELVHVEFVIKYEGYLKRQAELVEKFKKMEHQSIPAEFNYHTVSSLSSEAREKLSKIRPASLGQASRIAGVRHGDITVLLIYLEKYFRSQEPVSRETL